MLMRIIRIAAAWILVLFLTCASTGAQDASPRLEVFAAGGASFFNKGSGQASLTCPVCTGPVCPLVVCLPESVAVTSSFSKTGRLFGGARLRFTRHDALEASYSYSPNQFSLRQGTQFLGSGYNRVNLISFNYVRYLGLGTHVQSFATVGLGTNHFSGPSSAPLVVSGLLEANNGYQFAWNFGAGADLVLQRRLTLRLELRDYVTGLPSIIGGTSHNVVPSVGIVFRLK
jgi:hypothetical protein